MIIYHTSLGSKPLRRVFHFDNQPTKLVSNIQPLFGYWYFIIWLLVRPSKICYFPITSNSKQIIKIKKHTWKIVIMPQGKNAYISILIIKPLETV